MNQESYANLEWSYEGKRKFKIKFKIIKKYLKKQVVGFITNQKKLKTFCVVHTTLKYKKLKFIN